MPSTLSIAPLAEPYASQWRAIEEQFARVGDGLAAARARSALADRIILRLYQEWASPDPAGPENFAVVAVGGYGRAELFPHSDVDILFLFAGERDRALHGDAAAAISRALWDLRMRVGHSTHTLAECGELQRGNLQFSVALLDSRPLAGDSQLFARLHDRVIPRLVARERRDLAGDLIEMTRRRHARHGGTIFHLEPDLKEAPGGLRDYHVARWLGQIGELERAARWPVPPESAWPASRREATARAFQFLADARAFLHYQRHRDDNLLTYELQDLAAARGIGGGSGPVTADEWMRAYFRHARAIERLAKQLMDEVPPARSSLYGLFQDWRSRLSNADFSVLQGRVFPREPAAAARDPALLLGLFEMVARHGLDLSGEAERWVEEVLARVLSDGARPDAALTFADLGPRFRRILVLPHAARALRSMHQLGLLTALFLEFRAIDALVTRDYYHRYTVDEHSFRTIERVHELGGLSRPSRAPRAGKQALEADGKRPGWEQHFAEILAELEQPDLLFLALLFHDVGKGMNVAEHTAGSLQAVEDVFSRLDFPAADRDTVRFLIARHLDMSATLLRRDIFDPETVRAFARTVGTSERLKMLCLLTYADVSAVNPEAMTPWKAEMLWRLYAATFNDLARSLDEERLRPAEAGTAKLRNILELVPPSTESELNLFLEGLPIRYLETHSAEHVAAHFACFRRLGDQLVEVILARRDHVYELTVITHDRPFLFASLTGTLAAWGMNILKVDAFSNRRGVVLDTFRFADLHRTLELNPSETARLERTIAGVLAGEVNLGNLMRGQMNEGRARPAKIDIPTQVRFDDQSSSHSTLLELVTGDRPGLLYDVSRTLAELGCNISVALIDTEGQKAIDVFYLSSAGTKLLPREQERVRARLLRALSGKSSEAGAYGVTTGSST